MESSSFDYFVKCRKTFGSANQVKPYTVFNIRKKYRLIAFVDYALQSVSEYDEGHWTKLK
jgi:mRNA-degrading endonuclease HigB of HigAB toxin-antitoxin module